MAAAITRTKSGERDELLSRPTRYCSSSTASRISSSSGFASSSTNFSSPSSSPDLLNRSSTSSPVKFNVHNGGGSSQFYTAPVKLSVDPRRSVSMVTKSVNQASNNVPKTASCMCSPSTHPGAFRCRMHKTASSWSHSDADCNSPKSQTQNTASPAYARLFVRRSATMNSIARIGGVEGETARRVLATLIRPTETINPPKPGDFKPRPSRLSKMSRAEDK